MNVKGMAHQVGSVCAAAETLVCLRQPGAAAHVHFISGEKIGWILGAGQDECYN